MAVAGTAVWRGASVEELVLGLLWRSQGVKSVSVASALQAEGELGREAKLWVHRRLGEGGGGGLSG